jgi:hypothetical protein
MQQTRAPVNALRRRTYRFLPDTDSPSRLWSPSSQHNLARLDSARYHAHVVCPANKLTRHPVATHPLGRLPSFTLLNCRSDLRSNRNSTNLKFPLLTPTQLIYPPSPSILVVCLCLQVTIKAQCTIMLFHRMFAMSTSWFDLRKNLKSRRKIKKVSQQKVAIPSHHDEAFQEGIEAQGLLQRQERR